MQVNLKQIFFINFCLQFDFFCLESTEVSGSDAFLYIGSRESSQGDPCLLDARWKQICNLY